MWDKKIKEREWEEKEEKTEKGREIWKRIKERQLEERESQKIEKGKRESEMRSEKRDQRDE